MGPGDFVKVTYRGRQRRLPDGEEYWDETSPLTLMWDSRSYVVQPGDSAFAPFEAVTVAVGDPRSSDSTRVVRDEAGNVGWVVDRETEVRRLRTLYDNQTGDLAEIKYAPLLEVTDLEGDPIRTVLDDPDGDSVTTVQTTLLDRDQLLAQVQRQQRMIEQLANAQGIDLGQVGTVETQTSDSDPANPDADPDADADAPDAFATLPEG
jgi:hypothetical protein